MTTLFWHETRALPQPVTQKFSVTKFLLSNKALVFFLLAIAIEMGMPFLIWKTPVPGAARWLGDLTIAFLLIWTLSQMLVEDRIPSIMLFVLGLMSIGIAIAAFEGQSSIATAWGCWMMFKYPMVGLFVYMQKEWPVQLAGWFYRLSIVVLSFQVLVQIGQYLTGEPTGDNLAGTFGPHGVSPLSNFIFVITGFAFGNWLVDGNWKRLGYVLLLGSIASTLGAMRIYYVCMPALGVAAILIHLIKGGRLYNLIMYLCIFGAVVPMFVFAYNTLVAAPRDQKRLEDLLGENLNLDYLNTARYDVEDGKYELGRNFSVTYGWQLLQRDNVTLLFGYGVGARTSSVSLGILGAGLAESDYGTSSGTSLLVLMQELGVLGLLFLAAVLAWIVVILWRCTYPADDPNIRILAYGLILFTLGWPVWLWHSGAWRFSVSVIMYWGFIGYVVHYYFRLREQIINTDSAVVA